MGSPFLFFQQTIQIMCGVMVLSLGILFASVPYSADFSDTIYLLLKTAHPFLGALCVSREAWIGEMGR